MLQTKPLTNTEAAEMIADLDRIADRLFLAGQNYLGNQTQELAYCLEATVAEDCEQIG